MFLYPEKNIFWSTKKGNERFYHTMVLYLFSLGMHKVHEKEREKYEIESCCSKIKHFQLSFNISKLSKLYKIQK